MDKSKFLSPWPTPTTSEYWQMNQVVKNSYICEFGLIIPFQKPLKYGIIDK